MEINGPGQVKRKVRGPYHTRHVLLQAIIPFFFSGCGRESGRVESRESERKRAKTWHFFNRESNSSMLGKEGKSIDWSRSLHAM